MVALGPEGKAFKSFLYTLPFFNVIITYYFLH